MTCIESCENDAVTLKAWYRPGDGRGTVLFFHGNAGHRGYREPVLRAFASRGWGVMIPDYRGYGGSSGSPSEQGLYADGAACRAWLRENETAVSWFYPAIGLSVLIDDEASEVLEYQPPRDFIMPPGVSTGPTVR